MSPNTSSHTKIIASAFFYLFSLFYPAFTHRPATFTWPKKLGYNTHLRELVESVSVALARSVASALLWNTDYRRACPLARRGGLGSPGEVRAAAPVGGGA